MKHTLLLCISFILCGSISLSYSLGQQDNHAPVVKISAPANNASYSPGSQVAYQVNVSDKEDGDSRYNEINGKEVVTEVRFVPNKNKLNALLKNNSDADPPGLAVIRQSNCFNCHNFESKALGPSFEDVSKKYSAMKSAPDTLIKRIKNGSVGVWGREKMPSHPELSAVQIRNAVMWILKDSSKPGIDYYNGLSGIIWLPADKKGIYVITSSYVDHGLKTAPAKHLEGRDRITISVK
ncbi:MAG TPA: c-type cytochrome [Mucilaginibacter sp.]|nr:c-type cytochrome [Mucilaginibacter sp.]